MKHEDDMSRREWEQLEYRCKKRKARVVYPTELRDDDFSHLVSKSPGWGTHKNLLTHVRKNVGYFLFICEKIYTILRYNEGPLQLQSCVYKKNKGTI